MGNYLGRHLILDIWCSINAPELLELEDARLTLEASAEAAGATILDSRWHHFGEGYGYTGVVVLSESHISIHTWPEKGYAAIDIFYCGDCDPEDSVETIIDYFEPIRYESDLLERGKR